jgi:hypothetical protein
MKNISRNRILNFSTKKFKNTFKNLINIHIIDKYVRIRLYLKVYNIFKNKLTVPAIFSYKSVNYKNYTEQRKNWNC